MKIYEIISNGDLLLSIHVYLVEGECIYGCDRAESGHTLVLSWFDEILDFSR